MSKRYEQISYQTIYIDSKQYENILNIICSMELQIKAQGHIIVHLPIRLNFKKLTIPNAGIVI